jgi:hypothetical protein
MMGLRASLGRTGEHLEILGESLSSIVETTSLYLKRLFWVLDEKCIE